MDFRREELTKRAAESSGLHRTLVRPWTSRFGARDLGTASRACLPKGSFWKGLAMTCRIGVIPHGC